MPSELQAANKKRKAVTAGKSNRSKRTKTANIDDRLKQLEEKEKNENDVEAPKGNSDESEQEEEEEVIFLTNKSEKLL